MRLVLVDDDPLFRAELAGLLGDDGHDVVAVGAPSEALAALERTPADALLTDLRMPGSSGVALLDEVRERWPEVRTVLVTGESSEEVVLRALDHGAFNFLGKPFRIEEVRRILGLVELDVGYIDALCPLEPPSSVVAQLRAAGHRRVGWLADARVAAPDGATALPLEPGRIAESLDLARPFFEGPEPPGVVVLAEPALLPEEGVASALELVGRVTRWAGERAHVAVGVGRGWRTGAAVIALWGRLAGEPAQEPVSRLLGPQRREILRVLRSGERSVAELLPQLGSRDDLRTRFYLENLRRAGLVRTLEGRERRFATTERGERVGRVLDAVARFGPRLPNGHRLFGIPPGALRRGPS